MNWLFNEFGRSTGYNYLALYFRRDIYGYLPLNDCMFKFTNGPWIDINMYSNNNVFNTIIKDIREFR